MALCRLAYAHNQQYCYQDVWLANCRVWTARWLSGRWWSAERIRLFPLVPATDAFKIHETLMDSHIEDLAAMAAGLISARMLHVRLSGNEGTGTDWHRLDPFVRWGRRHPSDGDAYDNTGVPKTSARNEDSGYRREYFLCRG